MREIRDLRGEQQQEFADHLNEAAKKLGLAIRYDYDEVSRRETARRRLSPEDYATVAMLDPERRGWTYVAFGYAVKVGKDARLLLGGESGQGRTG